MDKKYEMTESEFIEIARQKYGQISELSKSATLYEHEKEFDQIWVSLGAEILEQSLGELPNDKRKKNDSNQIWPSNYFK